MAFSFNGSTDQIAIGNFNLPSRGSLSAWVNPTNPVGGGTYQGVVVHIVAGAQLSIYYKTAPSIQFAYYVVTAGGTIGQDPGSAILSTGVWFHVAMTYDSVNGLKTFVNGISDGTQAANGAIPTSVAPTGIGYDPGNAGRNITATLAELAEWNAVLTISEIKALARGVRPYQIRPQNILGDWRLDGYVTRDRSIFARNGVLTGTKLVPGPPLISASPVPININIKSSGVGGGGGGVVFRRTSSALGTRTGSRQVQR